MHNSDFWKRGERKRELRELRARERLDTNTRNFSAHLYTRSHSHTIIKRAKAK
jgi:hypothetical protein